MNCDPLSSAVFSPVLLFTRKQAAFTDCAVIHQGSQVVALRPESFRLLPAEDDEEGAAVSRQRLEGPRTYEDVTFTDSSALQDECGEKASISSGEAED